MCMICVDYKKGLLTNAEALSNAFESTYPSAHFDEIVDLLDMKEEEDTNG